jgi:hypothetical protein
VAAAARMWTFVPLSPLPLRRRLLHLRRRVRGDLYRSSAGTSCRQASEAGLADAGYVAAGGRRRGFPSTWSIGSGGVATRTSSGFFPADVPQRRQSRRRRVRFEVHKAAMSARVLLRVLVCGFHFFFRSGVLDGGGCRRCSSEVCTKIFRVSLLFSFL